MSEKHFAELLGREERGIVQSVFDGAKDFGRGVIQSGIENPINGIGQIAGLPRIDIVDAESRGAMASAGELVGNVGVMAALSYAGMKAAPGLGRNLRFAAAGALHSGLFTPSNPEGNLLADRTRAATVGLVSMAAYSGSLKYMEYNMPHPAGRKLWENLLLHGSSGALSGFAGTQTESLLRKGDLADPWDTLKGTAYGAAFGLGFGTLDHAVRTAQLAMARSGAGRADTVTYKADGVDDSLVDFLSRRDRNVLKIQRDVSGSVVRVERTILSNDPSRGPGLFIDGRDDFYKTTGGDWFWKPVRPGRGPLPTLRLNPVIEARDGSMTFPSPTATKVHIVRPDGSVEIIPKS